MAVVEIVSRKDAIKKQARNLGFDDCRVTTAERPQSATQFEQWLAEGQHGEMDYLRRNAAKRVDPQKVLPGAKSIVVLAASYGEVQSPKSRVQSQEVERLGTDHASGVTHHAFVSSTLDPRPSASCWDVKHILKLIVMSATYRQSASTDDERLKRDPYNRLLARGPRFRIDPEMIRDQALAVSGLLNPEVGGPSVYPVQVPNLWKELGFLRPEIGMSEC